MPVILEILSSTSIDELESYPQQLLRNLNFASSTTVCEPIYPVPPVTNILYAIFSFFQN